MRLRNRGRAAGLANIVTPMLSAAMRRANRKDLTRLAAVFSRPEGPGASG